MESDVHFTHYLALVCCVLLTTSAQLCLKMGARREGHVLRSFFNPFTFTGYALFGLGTVLAVYAMQAVDMKIGSTWAGIPYVLVVVLANLLLKEPLSRGKLVGCTFIVLGIVIFHLA